MDVIFTTDDETYIFSALQKLFEFPLCDVNRIKHDKEFMLHKACRNGWIKIVQLYMEDDRANLNEYDVTVMIPNNHHF